MAAVEDRFWAKVDKSDPDSCWVWTGSRRGLGYGCLNVAGQSRSAHRISWELAYGELPAGLYVCHHCDNPPCVRPDHLFLGTHADNMRDRQIKGRATALRGRRNGRAKLSEAQVLEIRQRRSNGERCQALADEYGVSNQLVSLIGRSRVWTHVA